MDLEFGVWFGGNDTATDELSLLFRSFIAAAAPFLPSADADSDGSTLSLSWGCDVGVWGSKSDMTRGHSNHLSARVAEGVFLSEEYTRAGCQSAVPPISTWSCEIDWHWRTATWRRTWEMRSEVWRGSRGHKVSEC